ncbi:histone h2b.2 [Phtheirospermum japonicum]|uniref:Histone h2b.2 n=1 Tax=Phtheirospermum japonicum TaxID=374723 RepID=A0A830CMG0_9LAMI|nr:histone h2b.2 [Phtheirospermum japonicum]
MKQVHPGMGISWKAMTIIDNLMGDMFGRLAEEAAQMLKYTRRQTMTSREIQGAVQAGAARGAGEACHCGGD